MVNQLRGLVSDATLLAQLPFIGDVQKELDQLEEQKQANIDMYAFSNTNSEDEVNEQ